MLESTPMVRGLQWLVWIPLAGVPTAIHEFGHGLVAAYGTKKTVCIDLARAPRTPGRQFGQFHVRAEPQFSVGGFCWGQPRSRWHLILILLGGPLLVAIIAGATIGAGTLLEAPALSAYGIYLAVVGGVGSIVPLPFGQTDGRLIFRSIRDACRRTSFNATYRSPGWAPPQQCQCYGQAPATDSVQNPSA